MIVKLIWMNWLNVFNWNKIIYRVIIWIWVTTVIIYWERHQVWDKLLAEEILAKYLWC